jgi:hypothetical protein
MTKKPKRAKFEPPLCIFCGKPGMSEEHLFTDWLRADFPRTSHDSHVYATIDVDRQRSTVRHRHGHSGSRKSKRVCKKCNNIWISQIDNGLRTILPPIYKGAEQIIDQNKQAALAVWLTKISMVGDSLEPSKSKVPQHQRTWILAARTPPLGFQIWLGSLDDREFGELGIYQNRGG